MYHCNFFDLSMLRVGIQLKLNTCFLLKHNFRECMIHVQRIIAKKKNSVGFWAIYREFICLQAITTKHSPNSGIRMHFYQESRAFITCLYKKLMAFVQATIEIWWLWPGGGVLPDNKCTAQFNRPPFLYRYSVNFSARNKPTRRFCLHAGT